MTNEFIVSTNEILFVDESSFRAHGGKHLHFGAVDGDSVHLYASGSLSAIHCRQIITHGTASCGRVPSMA